MFLLGGLFSLARGAPINTILLILAGVFGVVALIAAATARRSRQSSPPPPDRPLQPTSGRKVEVSQHRVRRSRLSGKP